MRLSGLTRRQALLGGAGLSLTGIASRAFGASRKPDILFIMADDLGYADVSCYGRQEYQTPHIDSLAMQGMRFLQAYANSSVCSATRTALATGRYQSRLQIGLDEPEGFRPVGLPAGHPTLASLLKKQGYSTALIGKWHLGLKDEFNPLNFGYDHFYGVRSGGADYFRHDRDFWNDNVPATETGYMTELLGNHAVTTLEKYASEPSPYLMSLHFTAPHWPWEGPNDQAESDRVSKTPGGLLDLDGGTMKTYAEMVVAMDEQIGRVLKVIEDSGRADNTIVIFTSDNGGERFSNTWPFTGKKTELLEGGIRIPNIVRWPAKVPAGTQSQQVTISMDWLPTLLAAAGGRPDGRYPSDGISILPQLTKGAGNVARKLFWRYYSLGQEALREGDYKYLKVMGHTFLFNVVDDPLERANLKKRFPDVFARLAANWEAWNKTMLPYTDANVSWTFSGEMLPDHFGAPGPTVPKPPPAPLSQAPAAAAPPEAVP